MMKNHPHNKQTNITKTWRINYQLKRWDDVGWLHALSRHFVSVFSMRKRSCYMNSRTLILLSSSSFSCAHRLHVPVWLEMSWSRLWSSHHHNSNRRRWTRRNGNCKIIITFPQNHLQCFHFILGMTFLWFTTEQEDDDDEEEQANQRLSWTLTAKSRERWKKLNIYVTCTFCQYLSLSLPSTVDPLHPHNNITRRHIQVQSSHPRMNSSSSRGTTIASAERHQLETRDEREIGQDYEQQGGAKLLKRTGWRNCLIVNWQCGEKAMVQTKHRPDWISAPHQSKNFPAVFSPIRC